MTVADKNLAATEEGGATPIASAEAAAGVAKESTRSFLQAARRNLTEVEAASPAGLRWLTYDAERLDQDCTALRGEISELRQRYDSLKDQFSDQRVELEKLKGLSNLSAQNEYLSYLCLSAGSAGLGVTPGYISVSGASALAWIVMVVSGVLVVGGLVLRIWKK